MSTDRLCILRAGLYAEFIDWSKTMPFPLGVTLFLASSPDYLPAQSRKPSPPPAAAAIVTLRSPKTRLCVFRDPLGTVSCFIERALLMPLTLFDRLGKVFVAPLRAIRVLSSDSGSSC